MSNDLSPSLSPQAGSCVNNLSLDSHGNPGLSILQSSQSAWMDEDHPRVCADDGVHINSSVPSPFETSALSPSLWDPLEIDGTVKPPKTNEDDEEFGEFVSASADPLKQPVFSTADDDHETQSLLNLESESGVEFGAIAGTGVVQPVFARLDNSTRRVRQAGKNIQRKWQILQDMRLVRPKATDQFAAVSEPPTPKTPLEELAELARQSAKITDAIKQQQTRHSVVTTASLDWVMRPVSFATTVSKDIRLELICDLEDRVAAERAASNDSSV